MRNNTAYQLLVFTVLGVYYGISKVIFDKIYETSKVVIDEQFHLAQGKLYSQGNYSYWDPKITTLPGLYLISRLLGVFCDCNTYYLRLINLFASGLNFVLFSSILKYVYAGSTESQLKIVLQAFNLTILPPLYFFSHLYYTDTLSLTFILLFVRLSLSNTYNFFTLITGLYSIMMRQTNIVWIVMALGRKLLNIGIRSSRVYGNKYVSDLTLNRNSLIAADVDKSKLKAYYNLKDAILAIYYHITTCFTTFTKFVTYQDFMFIVTQVLIIIAFAVFIFVNGSVVVGDKKAHEAAIHIPQLLYFLLFYGVFGLPFVLYNLKATFIFVWHSKYKLVILSLILLAVVHYNTLVHPYLLADNRHYTFYVWNRWFGKYEHARYTMVPVYIFLLSNLYVNLRDQNCVSFLMPYTMCTCLVLCLQRMVEVRYFIVPYIIIRFRFVKPTMAVVLAEMLLYLAINAVTLNIFFTKEIIWKDFDYVQRIIW